MKWNPSTADPAPEHNDVPSGSGANTRDSLDQLIQSAVAEGFAELRKELAPARRFVNPVESETFRVPATVKRYSSLKHFVGPDADERAYRFGMFCLGVYGKKQGIDFCLRQGIPLIDASGEIVRDVTTKTSRENVNTSSGFLVPDEFQNDLIDLREKFGVFRQNAKIVPMASDTRSDPRRVNGVTAYFVGESTAATLSDKQWDRVRLTAKKLMVLTKYSNELNEDAVLNIGDDLAGEIAYAFALKEDQCGFIGDGSSTYGGIVGVTNKLLMVDPTGTNNPANIMGLVVASGTGYATSYNSIVLSDFNKLVATLPEYADVPGQTKWYCSKFFWGSVMQKLATAAGGNRVAEIEDTPLRKSFLGYDVVISQVMPKTSATSQVCCLFGNLRMAARLGDRRQTTIQMSEHALNAFEQDEVVIRGTERFDIVVHDVGDPTAGAGPAKSAQAGNVAGPIVGLITAGS
ncbi:MAG TPA: phage major capsid protein [Tepidisphaeraceae bacterium]|nr:phage major capsid protein [Tepidisphaeraceae bacterium]